MGDADGDGGEALSLHCPICYGEDCGEAGYATLICGHIYHAKCLENSLKFKKECPTCRCPAKPTEAGRRDGGASHPRCPCKTGQPLRLYHLQRPRGGAAAGASAQAGGDAAYRDAAAVAAAVQREAKMRDALQEERLKVAGLEGQVAELSEQIAKALDKAEQRKQRLVTKEREHQAATARLVEDKSRLEAQKQEVEQELRRTQQALHVLRMDQEKAKVSLAERDNEVMRRKREVALLRARIGGSGAPGLPELVELLGESREDWQVAYSIKVDELRRALESAAEARAEVERVSREAAQRLKSEQLAGAEALKAVAKERDECKRQAIALEYKLINAEQQLRDMAQPASLTPTPTQPAGAAAPHAAVAPGGLGPSHAAAPPRAPHAAPKAAAAGPPHGRRPATAPQAGSSHPRTQQPANPLRPAQLQGLQTSLRSAAASTGAAALSQQRTGAAAPSAAEAGGTPRESQPDVSEDDDDWELEELAMHCTAEEDGMGGDEGDGGESGEGEEGEQRSPVGGPGGSDGPSKRTLPDLGREETAGVSGSGAAVGVGGNGSGADGPPGKRRRQALGAVTAQDCGQTPPTAEDWGCGDAPGGSGLLCGTGSKQHGDTGAGGADADADGGDAGGGVFMDDDDDPVPALPRAYAGLFSNHAATAAGPPLRGVAAGGGGGPGSRGLGAASVGPSFAGKATNGAYGASGGAYGRSASSSSLVGEGPDGRGGITRFPLTSSYTHNIQKAAVGRPPSGGRGGRGGGQGRAPVAASGRIDAFLRPVVKPK